MYSPPPVIYFPRPTYFTRPTIEVPRLLDPEKSRAYHKSKDIAKYLAIAFAAITAIFIVTIAVLSAAVPPIGLVINVVLLTLGGLSAFSALATLTSLIVYGVFRHKLYAKI